MGIHSWVRASPAWWKKGGFEGVAGEEDLRAGGQGGGRGGEEGGEEGEGGEESVPGCELSD